MLVKIDDETFINPEHVCAVKLRPLMIGYYEL